MVGEKENKVDVAICVNVVMMGKKYNMGSLVTLHCCLAELYT